MTRNCAVGISVLLFVVFFVFGADARQSKRVLRDATLSVQPSSSVGGSAPPAPLAGSDTQSAATNNSTSSLPMGSGKGIAVSPPAPAATVTPLPSPPQKPKGENPLAQILSALGGAGANGGSPSEQNGGPGANGSGATSGSDSYPVEEEDQSSYGQYGSQYDRPMELSSETKVEGRDCSATSKIWQPPTKNPFRITSCHGWRASTQTTHRGMDMVIMASFANKTVNPVAPGRIVKSQYNGGYGCEIIIEHDSCPAAVGDSKCYSQYGHLRKVNGRCPSYVAGTQVTACSNIALEGDTGGDYPNHLHFELRTSAQAKTDLDPLTQFREWQAHKNYKAEESTCGTVGKGAAPGRATPNDAEDTEQRQ